MEDYKDISENIKDTLDQAENILLICHQQPDGDAIGALLALTTYLKSLEKNVVAFCYDPLPDNLAFLPNGHLLTSDHLIFTKSYDVVMILDCGNYNMTGAENLLAVLPPYTCINIDHHISNLGYGDINMVLPAASSTTEILYRLFKDWRVPISKDIATNLLCGIILDTGGFVNAATNYLTLETAADLINSGANINQMVQLTLANQNLNTLKLWGKALSRLQKNDKYGLVYTWLTQADFAECGINDNSTEGLSNFLHIIKEARIILVLSETTDGYVKGSMRTTDDDVDLNKLAKNFGGGGHKKAAGFTLPGRLQYDNNKLRII